jgi:hypothetical protein
MNYFILMNIIIVFAFSITQEVYGSVNEKFTAVLNGSNVLPPIKSDSSGIAEIEFVKDIAGRITAVSYNITIHNPTNITAIELHNAPEKINGTAIAKEFDISNLKKNNDSSIIIGTFGPQSTFLTSLGGKGITTLDSLEREMQMNQVYIDIHSLKHPQGEIRGQFH